MDDVERFGAYAAAFEKAYAEDDWASLEPFFHADATYDAGLPGLLGGVVEGRDAIFAWFDRVLNGFDRRFASRTVSVLAGPELRDGAVWVRGRAAYTAKGAPDLAFDLEETARFEDGRIRHLADRYEATTRQAMDAWLAAHGARLGIELAPR